MYPPRWLPGAVVAPREPLSDSPSRPVRRATHRRASYLEIRVESKPGELHSARNAAVGSMRAMRPLAFQTAAAVMARTRAAAALQQDVLVALLHALAHPPAQRFQGPDAAGQLQLAEVLGVGVPDPLDDVGKPASAPYSSRQRTRFSFENVFRRQKISPTMPITGWLPDRKSGASLRKRSRQRTIESRSASNCTPGSVGVDSSVPHRSASDSDPKSVA